MSLSPFQSVTRVAIEEMIRSQGSPSKFGIFLTEDEIQELVANLVRLLETSRNLKSAGDKYLSRGQGQETNPGPRPRGSGQRIDKV